MTTEQPSGQNRKLGRLFRSAVCVLHADPCMKVQYTEVQMGYLDMNIHIEVHTKYYTIYTHKLSKISPSKSCVNSYAERNS